MSKIFISEVEACWFCPSLGTDQNGTRWECKKSNDRRICWHGSPLEEKNHIPDWCPLPDSETFSAEEFDV